MQVLRYLRAQAGVQLFADEVLVLNNALNEIVNNMDIAEFHTLLGATREQAEQLLHDSGVLFDKMEKLDHGQNSA